MYLKPVTAVYIKNEKVKGINELPIKVFVKYLTSVAFVTVSS